MADAIHKIFKERRSFARKKLSTGAAPTGAQTAAFLRELVNMVRPHVGSAPLDCGEMIRQCFLTIQWDVRKNGAVAGSKACEAGDLVNFLETVVTRLRVGIATAGWGTGSRIVPEQMQPGKEPAVSTVQRACVSVPDESTVRARQGGCATAGQGPAAVEATQSMTTADRATAAENKVPALGTLTDEDLFYVAEVDETAALAAVQKEIEDQLERNHYIALERARSRR